MPSRQRTQRTRTVPHYSKDERRILSVHKDEYRRQTSAEGRASVLRNKILVDIFNHWESQGKLPQNDAESLATIKKLTAWLTNNWRRYRTAQTYHKRINITLRDVVRRTKRTEIHEEIETILGVEDLDPAAPECFQQRNKALTAIIQRLSPEERKELDDVAIKWSDHGYPEEERRRNADKRAFKKVQQEDRDRWLEMGMVSLSLVGWVNSKGAMSIAVHDTIAHNMGISGGETFEDKCGALVAEVKHKFWDYVVGLHKVTAPEVFRTVTTTLDVRPEIALTHDEEGFPILPDPSPDQPLLKVQLEKLLRSYVNEHYRLASGMNKVGTPWAALEANLFKFIPAEYIPPGVRFRDPRNMSGEEIQKSFDFWRARQLEYGAASALRWSYYINGRRETVPVEYGRRADEERAGEAVERRRQKRARARADETHEASPNDDLSDLHQMSITPTSTSDTPAMIPTGKQAEGALQTHVEETNGAGPNDDLNDLRQTSITPTPRSSLDTPAATPTGNYIGCALPCHMVHDHGVEHVATSSGTAVNAAHPAVQESPLPAGGVVEHQRPLSTIDGAPQAANGPYDGLPRYIVSLSDVQNLTPDNNIVAVQSPTPEEDHRTPIASKRKRGSADEETQTSKKTMRIHDLALREAVSITGDETLGSVMLATPTDRVQTRAGGRAACPIGSRS